MNMEIQGGLLKEAFLAHFAAKCGLLFVLFKVVMHCVLVLFSYATVGADKVTIFIFNVFIWHSSVLFVSGKPGVKLFGSTIRYGSTRFQFFALGLID